ncbi:hypothetical protein [Aestuariibacter salexigens]|uniref:hypothetical protein n=1 Tax=Aestuariibacter salexigens TaxID=226010 RepID=UPI000424C123|nr:hypothetical protein [Aestuariibacter salexigens]
MTVNLSQFTSLFEIGFALHFAVAFLDRIHARQLPVRLERISARIKSLERFKEFIIDKERQPGPDFQLQLGYVTITHPVWLKHNDQLLDQLYALRQDVNGQIKVLKRILTVLTTLSVLVALYAVTVLFIIGLDFDIVRSLDSLTAATIVLMQLLPLPCAAGIFFFVSRKMSHDVDRKIRGISERNLMLGKPGESAKKNFASLEQVYKWDTHRNGIIEDVL